MPLLLGACPSFASIWVRLRDDDIHVAEDGRRLHYLDAAELATHLVGLLRAGRDGEVRATLDVIERLHLEGDAYVRELATIGYLEDVLGEVRSTPEEMARIDSWLGPESRRWWHGLLEFWEGRSSVVRAVES